MLRCRQIFSIILKAFSTLCCCSTWLVGGRALGGSDRSRLWVSLPLPDIRGMRLPPPLFAASRTSICPLAPAARGLGMHSPSKCPALGRSGRAPASTAQMPGSLRSIDILECLCRESNPHSNICILSQKVSSFLISIHFITTHRVRQTNKKAACDSSGLVPQIFSFLVAHQLESVICIQDSTANLSSSPHWAVRKSFE